MSFEIIPVRAFQDNYIWTIRNRECAAVIDPGDARPVLDYLAHERLQLVAILNTHHHADHVGGNGGLLRRRDVPVYGPHDGRIAEVTHRLRAGDRVRLPQFALEFEVLEIPGHTRTHIAFYAPRVLFCGDTLFACGCGRLFEGTPREMVTSLAKLAALPEDTRVYCGHEYTLSNIRFAKAVDGGNPALLALEHEAQELRSRDLPTVPSTIAREKATNPFLRCLEPVVVAAASGYAGKNLEDPVDVFAALREWKNRS